MEEFSEFDLSWMEKTIEKMPVKNWLYKFMCFISFRRKRKFTFKEMFLIMRNLNSKYGEHKSFEIAMYRTLKIYKFQYNNYPEGFVEKKND